MTNNTINPLIQLEPNNLWTCFYELTQIPRPSHYEDAIQQYIFEFGESLGLETKKDHVGNIIITKPATAGLENKQGVILQSHLDMVPQANKDTPHDFINDPIQAYIDTEQNNEWVTARGTTLGADNGIGVAAIMAVLADKTIQHGPIEALFTSTEETGMIGAFGLQAGQLKGSILLNLDSEDEGELYVGCAGGIDVNGEFSITREEKNTANQQTYKITLNGLKGGHSGLDIIKQLGNANKLLVRWLITINKEFNQAVSLIHLNGGNLRNAITREAEAIISFNADLEEKIREYNAEFLTIIQNEYCTVEKNINLGLTVEPSSTHPMSQASQNQLLHLINASPDGVYRMSESMQGLVETSCNLAIIDSHSNDNQVAIKSLIRGSLDSTKQLQADEISSLFALSSDASVSFSGEYPGWQPNLDSSILALMKNTGEEVFGSIPEIKGIHAGLECGILGQNYPNWDMISFGPTIRGAHSPDEKVHIKSVSTFYEWLLLTLQNIPQA